MPDTPIVLIGHGSRQRLHLVKAKVPPPPSYEGEWATSYCGRSGRLTLTDLTEDPRPLCSLCAWKSKPDDE